MVHWKKCLVVNLLLPTCYIATKVQRYRFIRVSSTTNCDSYKSKPVKPAGWIIVCQWRLLTSCTSIDLHNINHVLFRMQLRLCHVLMVGELFSKLRLADEENLVWAIERRNLLGMAVFDFRQSPHYDMESCNNSRRVNVVISICTARLVFHGNKWTAVPEMFVEKPDQMIMQNRHCHWTTESDNCFIFLEILAQRVAYIHLSS